MKSNLTDLSKFKDSKKKKNNNKNGKEGKKPGSIFYIKFMMTDRKKSTNIKSQNKKNFVKNKKIEKKFKKELNNIKRKNKHED